MLQKPDITIQIGNDEFRLGDHIKSLEYSLSESRNQSYVNFTIYDYNGEIANKYLEASYKKGGLIPVAPPTGENAQETQYGNTTSSSLEDNTGTSGYSLNVTLNNDDNGTVSRGGIFNPEIIAFLDTIASKESAPGQGLTRLGYFSNNGIGQSTGYFQETEAKGGFPISAGQNYNIGRYQFKKQDYDHARKSDPAINNYLPAIQDKIAYFKLSYRGALPYILRGDIETAISKAASEWASFPTIDNPKGQYNQVQPGTTMAGLVGYYNTRLNYYKSLQINTNKQASRLKQGNTPTKNIDEDYITKSVINQTAQVSFYGVGFDGKKTASGEIFRTNQDYTAAHNTLAFGTLVRCTWLTNNKFVIVRINDRGGFVKLGRQLDLSTVAMKALSDNTNDAIAAGVITAKLEIVEKKLTPGGDFKDIAKSQAIRTVEQEKNAPPESQSEEIAYKGQQIFLEISLDGGKNYGVTSFIHQGTRPSAMGKHLLGFSGVAVSWKLNRQLKSTRFTNITLKGLATNIARQNRLELVMKEEGDFIENVAQVSLTDWKFLQLICDRQGFNLRTIGRQLYIDKITVNNPRTGGYVITDAIENRIITLDIEDIATTSTNFDYSPGTISTTINSDTGNFVSIEKKKEATTAIGQQLPPIQLGNNYTNPRNAEKKKKEFILTVSMYAIQEDIENLTPDTPIFLDINSEKLTFLSNKSWFLENVTYRYDAGVVIANLKLYQLLESTEVTIDNGGQGNSQLGEYNNAGVGNLSAYQIRNPDGSSVNTFENLKPHWRGTGGYAVRTPRTGQADGVISHMKGNTNELVYDFTVFKGGSSSVPVPSPVAGVVTRAGEGYGRIAIEDSSGAITQILHMSDLRVKIGDRVLFGSILGTQNRVDAGGASTGVHIHFQGAELVLRRYITALVTGDFN